MLALVLGAMASGAQEPAEFPARAEIVQLDVIVLDRDGKPVTGLTASDFTVFEDERPQGLVRFEPVVILGAARAQERPLAVSRPVTHEPTEGRYLVAFFDDHHLSPSGTELARRAVGPFLAEGLRDGDVVTVVAPASRIWWTARTAWERRQLPLAVARVAGQLKRDPFATGKSEWEAMREIEHGFEPSKSGARADSQGVRASSQQVLDQRAESAGSSLGSGLGFLAWEIYRVAVNRMLQTLEPLEQVIGRLHAVKGRKTVLFFSEGFVRAPGLAALERVVERARRANVAVEMIDPRGLRSGLPMAQDSTGAPQGSSGGDSGSPLTWLETSAGGSYFIAKATGGRGIITNDIAGAMRDVVDESAAYYLLGYALPEGEPGDRRVRVRVRGDGYQVRARERYYVGAVDPPAEELSPAMLALQAAGDASGLSMRAATLCFDAAGDGSEVATTLALEIDPLPGEASQRRLRLLVEAQPLAGGAPLRDSADLTLEATDRPRLVSREWALAPGVWQARIVLHEPAAERVGSVLHTFEVPEPRGLRIGGVVLGEPTPGGAVPRLDRRYRPGDTLVVRFGVFGAAPDPATGGPRVISAAAVVGGGRRLEGSGESAIEPDPDGGLTRQLALPLRGVAPGSYELQIEVRDAVLGERSERLEPFEVVG